MNAHSCKLLVLLAAIASLAACGGGGDGGGTGPPVNSPPVASFTATPATGAAPLTVQFDASASSDPGGSIATYGWSFGDGAATGSGVTVTHVYPTGGTYTASLTVTDNLGVTGSATRQITVTSATVPSVVGLAQGAATAVIVGAGLTVGSVSGANSTTMPAGSVISQNPAAGTAIAPASAVSLVVSTGTSGTNLPPAAYFTVTPASGAAPLTVRLDATASHDSDGSIAGFSWNFGDGTATGTGLLVGHVYQSPGTFTATLTVTDNLGATATHSVQVTVSLIGVTASVENSVGGLVGDSLPVLAVVQSVYEVGGVVAAIAGRETALTYDPQRSAFRGTLSLAGEPPGNFTLTVRATDVRGNVDDVSLIVTHDTPPVLTILKPSNESVALPDMPLDISCTDDLPGCVVEVRLYLGMGQGTVLIASAPTALSGSADLSAWIGTRQRYDFYAKDSAGQSTSQPLYVYVESPARLAIVTEVPGVILDADETRLLFRERQETGDRLAIYSRATTLTEDIPPVGNRYVPKPGYLTPSGAVFVAQDADSSFNSRPYLWRQGTLTELAQSLDSPDSLMASGDYAIWNTGANLYRVNTTTGVPTLISSEAGNWGNSVAEDGTVVFWTAGTYQIVRDRSGTQTTLTSDTTQWHIYPVTDGSNVVYRKSDPAGLEQQFAIALIEGNNLVSLTEKRTREPDPFDDYQINSGWTAFTDLGTQQQLHVFTRSPQGVVTRLTDFATDSYIDRLGATGEVMIINGGKRFFSRGNGLVEVSSSSGTSYWLQGAWYVAIGNALLAVDTGG